MLQGVVNAFKLPDLRRKLLITFLILVIYRLAAHVPLPNINRSVLEQIAETNQLINLMNMLSGGAMTNFSVMMLGVSPYITATIIFQLLIPLWPKLEELQKQGQAGRDKLNRYQYYVTIPLALLQAYGQVRVLQASYSPPVIAPQNFGFTPEALLPTISTLLTLAAGTMFAIWLGELITNDGIGNGLSIIIFGGIVSIIPRNLAGLWGNWVELITFIGVTVLTIVVIVYVQEGQRRIPVQYGKRVLAMRGNRLRVAGGQSTFIPLRVNSAGMIPLIFAQSLLMLPGVVASYLTNVEVAWLSKAAQVVYDVFNGNSPYYYVMYFAMVILFTYFYTDMIFQQQNMAEMLQKQGGFIPGIRPGRRTSDYLNGVLRRITLVGAVFLGVVAIMPWLVNLILGLFGIAGGSYSSRMIISSSGLLIAVGVVLDTMKQLEAQLRMRHYEGFIK